jgi:hypothetical protein
MFARFCSLHGVTVMRSAFAFASSLAAKGLRRERLASRIGPSSNRNAWKRCSAVGQTLPR